MCWRPIGGKVARVQEPAGPLDLALPPRVARTMPTIAAATMIATPSATNQRFRRWGPPDSTRRCGPAVLCCRPWLVRGGGGTRLFFFLATTRRKVSSARASLGAEEVGDGCKLCDDRSGRKRLEEAAAVRPRAQPRVEDGHDALISVAPDQAPETLAQLQDCRGKRVLREPVASLPRDALAARLDERIPRGREWQLVDHEERERLALDVDPLPEGRGREEDRVDVLAEPLQEPLARRVPLPKDGKLKPRRAARDQLVQRAVGGGEDERAARREPAERDDLVRQPVVIAWRARLRNAGRDVDERLVAVVEGRRKDQLARVVESQPAADESGVERGGDEDRRPLALPQALAEEARDVHGRPRDRTGLGPRHAVGVIEREATLHVLGGDERAPGERVAVLAGARERRGEGGEGGGEHKTVLLELRLIGRGEAAAPGARVERPDETLAGPVDLRQRPRRRRAALLAAEALDVALELAEPRE